MRAALLTEGSLSVAEIPEPRPAPGEALVRVAIAGVCATDLQLVAGYMGYSGVLGHEFVGRIAAAPDAPERVGERVAGEINAACGACAACAAGLGRHCATRTVLGILGRDGAFAESLVLPLKNLHELPDMPLDRAVFVEPVAAAFEIPEQVEIRGRRVLVQGPGKLGRLCAEVCRLGGATVTVTGRSEASLAPLVAQGFDVLTEAAPRFDIVVEATGSPEGISAAFGRVRPRGTIVLKSTCAAPAALNLAPIVIDELVVVGSRCGPFEPAIAALAAGRLTPETTVGARFPLEDIHAALDAARDPDPARRKVLIDIAPGA